MSKSTSLIRRQRNGPRQRTGVATLWVILTLPVLFLLLLYAVEVGRLHLARHQLVTSLESAAMATAKKCATEDATTTQAARACGADFAMANLVARETPFIDTNRDPTADAENAGIGDGIVMGTLVELPSAAEFNASYLGSCGRTEGPNAVAVLRTSTSDWQTVKLCCREYVCMIVVGTINYGIADPPLVVRVRNVGSNSFEFFVQNVNDNSAMAGYDVHFLIVEAGVYTDAADGAKFEAFKYDSTVTDRNGNWVGENRGYSNAYANPVVVGQVMTYNDPDWSVFWSHNGNRTLPADSTGLYTGKHVGEDIDTTRADETIGYMVFEEGVGDLNGLQYYAGDTQRTVQAIDNSPPYTFAIPFPTAGTYAVASQTGERGGNGSFAHLHGNDPIDPGTISLSLDEDQISNAERSHVTEHVHYIAVQGPCVVRVRHTMNVAWYFNSLFGCVLNSPTVSGEATAYFDCADHCSKLLCIDEIITD